MIENNDLFNEIDAFDLEIADNLKQIISDEIRNSANKISLSRYMELALYHPVYGYYSNPRFKFGREGDFITAPLLSDLFASCLSNQLNELIEQSKFDSLSVLEFGAGNGQLMLDILKSDTYNKIHEYQILELSPSLRHMQQERLQQVLPELAHKVKWLDQLPTKYNGIIIANEVLDAIATEVVTWKSDGSILQRFVSLDSSNNFIYQDELLDPDSELFNIASQIEVEKTSNDFISEVQLLSRAFIKTLANILSTGYVILMDYGHSQSEYYNHSRCNGTLRGFYKQHLIDGILHYPGLIDITTSVDFTAVAVTGIDSGLDLIGYTTQANFLLNCGILDIVQNKKQNLTKSKQIDLLNQVNYLTSPNLMGDIFKVIGFSKNIDFDNWMGFCYNDRSYTL